MSLGRFAKCLAPVVASAALGLGQPLAQDLVVDSWGYQLQDIDLQQIAAEPEMDLVVIDYSATGDESGEWTPQEIAAVRASGKRVLAYLSIGEAEDYRFYWDPVWAVSPPSWLGPLNPNWPGNYKVRFWEGGWQEIVRQYLDRIVAQGFDGIYMDIIDAYYYWSEEVTERSDADALMIEFVASLRRYLDHHHRRPDLLMIPQNGEYILVEDDVTPELRQRYLSSIDAIGEEDVFFPGDAAEDNPLGPDAGRIAMLGLFQAAGKCVYSIEYLTQTALVEQYIENAAPQRFYPLATLRDLQVLNNPIVTAYPQQTPASLDAGGAPLVVAKVAGGPRLYWRWVCGATSFNVYAGTIDSLGLGVYDHACAQAGVQTLWADVSGTGGSTYFLVTARNGAGESGPGHDSAENPRPHLGVCPP